MNVMIPPEAHVTHIPAADVTFPQSTAATGNVFNQSFSVIQSAVDRNDFIIQIRASSLTRWRKKLANLRSAKFPWSDLLLAVATVCVGAFLGSLVADIKPNTWQYVFFFTLMPCGAVGAGVAYLSLRGKPIADVRNEIQDLLEDLPDPASESKK